MRGMSVLVAVLAGEVFLRAQTSAPQSAKGPRFEAASIKRNVSGSGASSWGGRGGRWTGTNITPLMLVTNAYQYESFRIAGAPGWMSSERYDISAVADSEAERTPVQAMLRTLLAERFNFAAHTEMRSVQTYTLVRSRDDGLLGPRMKPWTIDCDALRKAGQLQLPPPPRTIEDLATPRLCGMSAGGSTFRFYTAGGRSIGDLARVLMSELNAPVTDRTGLSGLFEMALHWNADPSAPNADPALPSLFTAIQEQLGLKLEARREPTEVLIIDRIDRPTPD
jgi:uncharacterized protein (TIGR03435 family)